MVKGIYFDGRRVIRPQALTKIDDTGMFARGLGGGNTLALVGEATGGEPGKVLWFTDPSYAKTIFRSGNLLTAIQRAYDPSAEVSGAYLVGAIRVNPALQAYGHLKDTNSNPLVEFTSVDYGVWNNQIKSRLESATTTGKKLTLTYGTAYDQGDNIYKKSIHLACADPKATAATCTIVNGTVAANRKLTTTITATPQKVYYPDGSTPITAPYTIPLTTTQYLFIGSDVQFNKTTFTVSVPNVVPSVMTGKYWNGSAWASLAITDGTQSPGGTTLGQSGDVTFTQPSDWAHTAAATTPTGPAIDLYWIMITVSVNLTGTTAASLITLGRGLSVLLGDYPTIQELVDYLDAQPHYEAYPATTEPDSDLSTDLDEVSALSFLALGNTTLSSGYSSGRVLSVSATTNFAIGDYIIISRLSQVSSGIVEEMRKITAIGSGTITVDSALSTTYSTGDIVREARVLNSDVQAIIDWVNDGNTGYVTAVYPSTTWASSTVYGVGRIVLPSTANDRMYVCVVAGTSGATEPVWTTTVGAYQSADGTVTWICRTAGRGAFLNQSDTYLSGGSEGTTAQADWDAALDALKTEDTPLVSCISYDPAVWASLSAHCTYMSTTGRKERIGFSGGFASADGYTNGLGKWSNSTLIGASIDKMLDYAEELNTDRVVYVGPGFKAYDENGTLTTYPGSIAAALVAGMAAGVDVATALTHKEINVIGLEYNLMWADLDRLLDGGVCPLEYDPGFGYRVCQSITTWLRNDKYNRREVSVRRTADYVARQVRDRLDRDFVGTKGTATTLISIKNATESVLQQMFRAELLAGDDSNPPYKNIQVRLEGDIAYVDFECSPVIPINYIPITIHLTVFTATLVA